jgi:hypothetical protein
MDMKSIVRYRKYIFNEAISDEVKSKSFKLKFIRGDSYWERNEESFGIRSLRILQIAIGISGGL